MFEHQDFNNTHVKLQEIKTIVKLTKVNKFDYMQYYCNFIIILLLIVCFLVFLIIILKQMTRQVSIDLSHIKMFYFANSLKGQLSI